MDAGNILVKLMTTELRHVEGTRREQEKRRKKGRSVPCLPSTPGVVPSTPGVVPGMGIEQCQPFGLHGRGRSGRGSSFW